MMLADLTSEFWGNPIYQKIIKVLIVLATGLPLVLLVSRIVSRVLRHRLGQQGSDLLARIVRYSGYVMVLVAVLQEFGFNLAAVLGAAGIAGVAIGFASQTSLSNLISGLFIVGERPFEKGDIIEVGAVSGTVEEIGLMALTLRTFDNRSVRIPNEMLVKNTVTTVTRYPIRRVDLTIGVAYTEAIDHVMRVLAGVADAHPAVLDEPETVIVFNGFGESSLNFMIGAWTIKADVMKVKNELPLRIKEAFDREGIEIPFPHRVLAPGKAMEPIPVVVRESRN
ncbi:mechanosensitive ion channel family protein [Luteolibacter flavescens]|uniref:Mechanosensitive ion channel family protein n=1 Tax=Luteolibacter flavescens TaxID=1859460 RepID=A0ABT3FT73_9BACT|nr:mechanosensitive ion channel family protein [Luteolibacter flavescens]MCW1886446.1 mechanosensitive ion channel family protein [Luteolibacter flavescens]